jgi:transcriptional regulator with XRE-family HTH domain
MNRLRDVRVLKRVTQFELRLQTGIHQAKISMIENGLVDARDDEKERFAEALGCRVRDLFPEQRAKSRETMEGSYEAVQGGEGGQS